MSQTEGTAVPSGAKDFHNFDGISALLYKAIICCLELDMNILLHRTTPLNQL